MFLGLLVSTSPGGPERSRRGTAVYFSETIKRHLYNEQPQAAIDNSPAALGVLKGFGNTHKLLLPH